MLFFFFFRCCKIASIGSGLWRRFALVFDEFVATSRVAPPPADSSLTSNLWHRSAVGKHFFFIVCCSPSFLFLASLCPGLPPMFLLIEIWLLILC